MDSNGEIHTGPVSVHEVEKSGLGGEKDGGALVVFGFVLLAKQPTNTSKSGF